MMEKTGGPEKMTCILCPKGCALMVWNKEGQCIVEGAGCKKGKGYGVQEKTDPHRNVASSVGVIHGVRELASVRLSRSIPKDQIFRVMDRIRSIRVEAPLQAGQVVLENVLDLGVDLIVTSSVGKRNDTK